MTTNQNQDRQQAGSSADDDDGFHLSRCSKGLFHNDFGFLSDPASFDLRLARASRSGPDSAAMPAPPAFGGAEQTAEMTELYLMALHRDLPLPLFGAAADDYLATLPDPSSERLAYWREQYGRLLDDGERLNGCDWFRGAADREAGHRDRPGDDPLTAGRRRFGCPVTSQNLFRGNTPGDDDGPYLSQFLLSDGPWSWPWPTAVPDAATGRENVQGVQPARYDVSVGGVFRLDRRLRPASPGQDFLTDWSSWLQTQNGDPPGGSHDRYIPAAAALSTAAPAMPLTDEPRFVTTPRDLASCAQAGPDCESFHRIYLTLAAARMPPDPGLLAAATRDGDDPRLAQLRHAEAAALLGQATLQALRQAGRPPAPAHWRAAPEAVGGLLNLLNPRCSPMMPHEDVPQNAVLRRLQPTLRQLSDSGLCERVIAHNRHQNRHLQQAFTHCLLPVAYPEGAPAYPDYPSRHALVAGACVTILKALFAMEDVYGIDIYLVEPGALAWQPAPDGASLVGSPQPGGLTLAGELNKFASNLSLGRCFAGVSYYSDYVEALRQGEMLALTLLSDTLRETPVYRDARLTVPLFYPTVLAPGRGLPVADEAASGETVRKVWVDRNGVSAVRRRSVGRGYGHAGLDLFADAGRRLVW